MLAQQSPNRGYLEFLILMHSLRYPLLWQISTKYLVSVIVRQNGNCENVNVLICLNVVSKNLQLAKSLLSSDVLYKLCASPSLFGKCTFKINTSHYTKL
jgi:hypothetical protein